MRHVRFNTATVLVITLASALISGILAVVFLAHRTFTTSWGEDIEFGEEYLNIEGQTLTQEDLEAISSLKRLHWIALKNCNVAECRLPELTFASKDLYEVSFEGTALWDTSFLSNLRVSELNLSDCDGVSSLDGLNLDVLYELHVDGTDVSDLSPLRHSDVRTVTFARTEVSDLSPLAEIEDLGEVDGSYSNVQSLDVLDSMRYLYSMRFDGCDLDPVGRVFFVPHLHGVSLAHTGLDDLSFLSRCKELAEVTVAGCEGVTNLSWLDRANIKTLTKLNVAQTGLATKDLAALSFFTKLEELTLDGLRLRDLSLCASLPELEFLSAVNCGLTDVSALKNHTKLETLLLGYNKLEDVSDIPYPTTEWPSFEVDLSHNQLASVADLPEGEYNLLMLQGNDPDVGRTIPAGMKCYNLVVPWFSGMEDTRLMEYATASRLYLLGCPPEAAKTLGEHYMAYRTVFLDDEDHLLDLLEENDLAFSLRADLTGYVPYVRTLKTQEDEQ